MVKQTNRHVLLIYVISRVILDPPTYKGTGISYGFCRKVMKRISSDQYKTIL